MKKMGTEKLNFIGRFWNGEPRNSISYACRELYYDSDKKRYVLINDHGIDCHPKSDRIQYLNRSEADEFALEKLSYSEWYNNFGG